MSELAAGTPGGERRPSRQPPAASSGSLGTALAALPADAQKVAADAAHQGFLAGFNAVLTLGALVSRGRGPGFVLVREREMEREPVDARVTPEQQPMSAVEAGT